MKRMIFFAALFVVGALGVIALIAAGVVGANANPGTFDWYTALRQTGARIPFILLCIMSLFWLLLCLVELSVKDDRS